MQEEHLFLDIGDERVFAVHHRTVERATQAVVLCHPLGEEKLWSHRVFVSFARALAASGVAVLRFDYRGEGDSDRDFRQTDLETRTEDAVVAIETVRALNPDAVSVTLVGLRFGTCVAVAAAKRCAQVSRIVLWDPVLDGATYMQSVLRVNLMYQMAVHRRVIENREALAVRLSNGGTANIEGYELSGRLFDQTSKFLLASELRTLKSEVWLVQIDKDAAPMRPDLVECASAYDHVKLAAAQEDAFWREIKTFYQCAEDLSEKTLAIIAPGHKS